MKKTLLVLAAGMGSRYGGLKQLDPVGPSGEVVLDYSVHDALAAGFSKVIFVIRREFEEDFRRVVIARYEKSVEVGIVYQDIDDLPMGEKRPSHREKPWGTGHAIWCARDAIKEPFLAVNADDFYGPEAFSIMSAFLSGEEGFGCDQFATVAYPLRNTLSEHGAVSRGICSMKNNLNLRTVNECSGIRRSPARMLEGVDTSGKRMEFSGTEPVSMNFWGFNRRVFPLLSQLFSEFLRNGGLSDPKSEFYIPSAVTAMIKDHGVTVQMLESVGRWFGVTYREDREAVAATLAQLVNQGHYKTPLWKHTK